MTSGTRAAKASGQRRFMLAAVAVLLAFALAVPAEGAGGEIFQIGGTVVVPRDRVVGGDVVAIGGPVEVFGIVRGDVVALGGHVIVHGTVFGDVVAVGETSRCVRAPGWTGTSPWWADRSTGMKGPSSAAASRRSR